MKAIKSIAVLGAAAGVLVAGAGAAAAYDGNVLERSGKRLHIGNDSGAQGAAIGSPGMGSGNLTQVSPRRRPTPVATPRPPRPAILNPSFGNSCTNS